MGVVALLFVLVRWAGVARVAAVGAAAARPIIVHLRGWHCFFLGACGGCCQRFGGRVCDGAPRHCSPVWWRFNIFWCPGAGVARAAAAGAAAALTYRVQYMQTVMLRPFPCLEGVRLALWRLGLPSRSPDPR